MMLKKKKDKLIYDSCIFSDIIMIINLKFFYKNNVILKNDFFDFLKKINDNFFINKLFLNTEVVFDDQIENLGKIDFEIIDICINYKCVQYKQNNNNYDDTTKTDINYYLPNLKLIKIDITNQKLNLLFFSKIFAISSFT